LQKYKKSGHCAPFHLGHSIGSFGANAGFYATKRVFHPKMTHFLPSEVFSFDDYLE
jgi:hypothetical protein